MDSSKCTKKCSHRTYRDGPEMAVTTVRAEKEKLLFLKNKGFTYSYIFALGIKFLIETEGEPPEKQESLSENLNEPLDPIVLYNRLLALEENDREQDKRIQAQGQEIQDIKNQGAQE